MAKYFEPAEEIGTGARSGLRDIPGNMMTSGGRGYVAQATRRMKAAQAASRGEAEFLRDTPAEEAQPVLVAREQIADRKVYTFDRMTIPAGIAVNVPAGAGLITPFSLLTVTIPADVRGVIRRFGWYTAGAATAQLFFGLFVNAERVLPGGRWVQDQMQTVLTYNPSSGSVDFDRLCECNVEVPPNGTITVRVSNANAVTGYQAWARIWGDHWSSIS